MSKNLEQHYQQLLAEFVQQAESKSDLKPGWMLDQDFELGKKVRDRRRDLTALKKWAGRPVPKKDDQEQPEDDDLRRLVPSSESVAGPKSCWPGHRKIGTQPGTGKNAGKRVNKCKKIKEEATPVMPDIQGMNPGESRDLGSGTRVTVNTDGTVSLTGGFGQYIYDQSGRVIKQQSPSMGGFTQDTDLDTGKTKTHYRKGPMSVSQDSQGRGSAEYTLGSEKFAASTESTQAGTRSAISGDEDHDELSKLLVQRLRRLAGL